MADSEAKLTSATNSSVEDCKKHLMKLFKDLTKDCKDESLRREFDMLVDYDALNACAVDMFSPLVDWGFLDEARELFKPQPDQVTLPEVAVFTIVMSAYAAAGKTMDALKVYHNMIATGVTVTSYTYITLICATAKDFSDLSFVGFAKKYILEMLDMGMRPPYPCYMSVMAAIVHQESAEEANKFLEQIKDKGFIPDHNGFRNIIGHIKEAMQVSYVCADLHHFNTLDKDVKKFVHKLHACPMNLIEWTVKMYDALVEDGNVAEALMLYKTIQQTRTEPSVLFYTLVIEAYLKFGKTKGALDAYLAMLAAGVAPNSYTYTVLIKGLAADPNFLGDARKYLLEMMDNGKQPNAAAYTAVIEGFARREDEAAENEGKDFVEVMMGKGFVPNAKEVREFSKGRPTPVIRRVLNMVLSKMRS